MPSSVSLGSKLESAIEKLVSSGRYQSKSEVIREGVRLVEEREKKLALLDEALARGMNDAKAGRMHSADDVFAELRARYQNKVGNAKK